MKMIVSIVKLKREMNNLMKREKQKKRRSV